MSPSNCRKSERDCALTDQSQVRPIRASWEGSRSNTKEDSEDQEGLEKQDWLHRRRDSRSNAGSGWPRSKCQPVQTQNWSGIRDLLRPREDVPDFAQNGQSRIHTRLECSVGSDWRESKRIGILVPTSAAMQEVACLQYSWEVQNSNLTWFLSPSVDCNLPHQQWALLRRWDPLLTLSRSLLKSGSLWLSDWVEVDANCETDLPDGELAQWRSHIHVGRMGWGLTVGLSAAVLASSELVDSSPCSALKDVWISSDCVERGFVQYRRMWNNQLALLPGSEESEARVVLSEHSRHGWFLLVPLHARRDSSSQQDCVLRTWSGYLRFRTGRRIEEFAGGLEVSWNGLQKRNLLWFVILHSEGEDVLRSKPQLLRSDELRRRGTRRGTRRGRDQVTLHLRLIQS